MNDLRALAIRRLGSGDLDGLSKWYTESIEAQVQYVVFVVRRSYILSVILEQITGINMVDSEDKKYVTDSAFLSCCPELADFYRENGRFPKIRLCDDTLIHGRNLNRVIENVEERLEELLGEEDKDTIHQALADAIQIRVYCYAENKHLLLKTRYMNDARYIVKYEPLKWRELSGHISSLIVESGVANATYINSEVIFRDEYERIIHSEEGVGYKRQVFQNLEGCIKVEFLKNPEEYVYAVYSLRILKNKAENFYRVIPFVFMPNLDDGETGILLKRIEELCIAKQYPAGFIAKLKGLYQVNGKRAFNEWVSLIISNAILRDFNMKYNITISDERKDLLNREIVKLGRNYRFDQTEDHIGYLKKCIEEAPIFEGVDQLSEILLACNHNRPIMKLGMHFSDNESMRNRLEDCFYEQGYYEEREAVLYNGMPSQQQGVTNRMVKNCCFLLKRLMDQNTSENVKYMISIFLLMMDVGVLSLSSHTAKGLRVVGYAQFAKAGEQSLLIKPLRNLQYVSFLCIAYDWCKNFNRDYYAHLRAFAASKYSSIGSEKMEELIEFIDLIAKVGQTIKDWGGSYYEKVSYEYQTQREYIEQQYEFEEEKNRYVDEYMKYNMNAHS